MSVNLRVGDVDQLMLMPPSMREWLPEDHLAFFVLDVVAELDLNAFYAAYRVDGKGGSVYDPAMMLAVLNRPGFRAHFLSWEGWHDAKQVRREHQGQGGPIGP